MLKAYLLDDEPLAIDRLRRMAAPLVHIIGSSSDPVEAIDEINSLAPDLLFLDIQMPELDGFAVLQKLSHQPLVIFTTAYDQYALQAFETNSVAYLLKPVELEKLRQAIAKVERLKTQDFGQLVTQIASRITPKYPERISSKTGDKIEFIDLGRITHFFAEDKLTYAATEGRNHVIDQTITELEERLDPERFCRIHRSTLVNLAWVAELYNYFGGKLVLKLKTPQKTELVVSRDRAKELRDKLGL